MGSLTEAFIDPSSTQSLAVTIPSLIIIMEFSFLTLINGLKTPDSEETKEFVGRQVELTDSVLKSCDTREKLREKLTELYDFPKYEVPFIAGDKYFYFHNTGLQPQKVLYVHDSLDGKAEVLLDPNRLSDDGTIALSICLEGDGGHRCRCR